MQNVPCGSGMNPTQNNSSDLYCDVFKHAQNVILFREMHLLYYYLDYKGLCDGSIRVSQSFSCVKHMKSRDQAVREWRSFAVTVFTV